MKRILGIAILFAMVSCAEMRGPEGDPGIPGGVLWKDATDRTVGYGDRFGVGYFDDAGLLWTVSPMTGQPAQYAVQMLLYETPDCTGDAWENQAPALIPVRYQDGYLIRPIAARMATIRYGSSLSMSGNTCTEAPADRPTVVATAFADFEVLAEMPESAVFVPPLYPVKPTGGDR